MNNQDKSPAKTVSKEVATKIFTQMVNDKRAFKAILNGASSTKGAISAIKAYNQSR
mgnify:CR=1 FL=1|jgi:hypothetical protein